MDGCEYAEWQRVEQEADERHEEAPTHAQKAAGDRRDEHEHIERGLAGEVVQGHEGRGVVSTTIRHETEAERDRDDRARVGAGGGRLDSNDSGRAIVRATIDLAHALDFTPAEALRWLRER